MPAKRYWKGASTFMMRPLPKGEYHWLKDFIERYRLSDPCEAFRVLIRLTDEVERFSTQQIQGKQWVTRIVGELIAGQSFGKDIEEVYTPPDDESSIG